jgi:hypothetical protein
MTDRKHHIGERVILGGTGRRWSGVNYAATVIESRDSDDTVKVRYADGGFKRFSRNQFNSLVVNDEGESPYHFRAYELFDDQYDPTAEAVDKAHALREELNNAVRAKDFAAAAALKNQIQHQFRSVEVLQIKKRDLVKAVQAEDFETAKNLQVELEQLKATMTTAAIASAEAPESVNFKEIFDKASKRALGGGLAGASAMVIQVCSLMWMRTTMNYQYRYGTTTKEAFKALYAQGGIRRFYRGIGPGLLQGPLSRFGDTASNTGALALLNALPMTRDLPIVFKTVGASMSAASFRIFLMPIDSVKTSLQVEGNLNALKKKIADKGLTALYHGSLAAAAATFAGHFPWWATYNTLDARVPKQDTMAGTLVRSAGMGFCASLVSDTTSNSIRVVKTVKQTSADNLGYVGTVKQIIAQDGLQGLFFRGLSTRLLSNAAQGVMFSVLWKYIDKTFFAPPDTQKN